LMRDDGGGGMKKWFREVPYAVYALAAGLLVWFLLYHYRTRGERSEPVPITVENSEEQVCHLDTGVVTGRVVWYKRDGASAADTLVFLRVRDGGGRLYQFVVGNSTEVTSHFPHTTHCPHSMANWLDAHPGSSAAVGVSKGQVVQVILHPAG
jgi:hypothetical protein